MRCRSYKQLTERMAKEMTAKLRANSFDKGGWVHIHPDFAIRRLLQEVGEFVVNPTWKEAADVANFAAMLANVTEAEKKEKP